MARKSKEFSTLENFLGCWFKREKKIHYDRHDKTMVETGGLEIEVGTGLVIMVTL